MTLMSKGARLRHSELEVAEGPAGVAAKAGSDYWRLPADCESSARAVAFDPPGSGASRQGVQLHPLQRPGNLAPHISRLTLCEYLNGMLNYVYRR